jgi:succinate dehydrogenase / fumarate reductase iron-sulfur subunit
MQAVCGGCAMVINGVPALACATFADEVKGRELVLEPLSKFPVVADLMVDRSIIYENLISAKANLDSVAKNDARHHEQQYSVAKCLKCGLCLEVCPNYSGEGKFFGAVGMNACFRTAEQLSGSAKRERLSYFAKHGDAGCSKSLACQVVCPAKIPLSVVISRLNRERFLSVFYRNK